MSIVASRVMRNRYVSGTRSTRTPRVGDGVLGVRFRLPAVRWRGVLLFTWTDRAVRRRSFGSDPCREPSGFLGRLVLVVTRHDHGMVHFGGTEPIVVFAAAPCAALRCLSTWSHRATLALDRAGPYAGPASDMPPWGRRTRARGQSLSADVGAWCLMCALSGDQSLRVHRVHGHVSSRLPARVRGSSPVN